MKSESLGAIHFINGKTEERKIKWLGLGHTDSDDLKLQTPMLTSTLYHDIQSVLYSNPWCLCIFIIRVLQKKPCVLNSHDHLPFLEGVAFFHFSTSLTIIKSHLVQVLPLLQWFSVRRDPSIFCAPINLYHLLAYHILPRLSSFMAYNLSYVLHLHK